jgi:YD repeat-containing protein
MRLGDNNERPGITGVETKMDLCLRGREARRTTSFGTLCLRITVLLLTTATLGPSVVWADYPAQEGRGILDGGLSITGIGPDDETACSARGPQWAWGRPRCAGVAISSNACGFAPSHDVRGFCSSTDTALGCAIACPVSWCPYGGTNSNGICINNTPCPDGGPRDPDTGACGVPPKNRGGCTGGADPNSQCPECCAGNPVNAGTGSKVQVEVVYRGTAVGPLVEQLTYNSQTLNDQFALWTGMFGKGWKGNFERKINGGVAVARAERPNGRELSFRAPASGNVYVPDADIADQLQHFTDSSGTTTSWRYIVAADDSTELYNPAGKLVSITDRAGLTITLTYSNASTPTQVAPLTGLLIGVTNPFGRSFSYVYDTLGRIASMTDPAGGIYSFVYDSSNNLASITFPDTKTRTFAYNEAAFTQGTALPNSLTGITDENGARFANFGYDTQGRAVSTEHAGGADRKTFDYSTPTATTITDALGVARSFGLTTLLRVVKNSGITGAPCPSCGPAVRSFDANGNVASTTDWNGNVTNRTYDLTRNLETTRTEAVGTPQARTIGTQWHPTFRLPVAVAEPLRITTYVYNGDGGASCGFQADGVTLVPGVPCSKTIQPTTDATGAQGFNAAPTGTPRTWTYTYNANGSVLTTDGPRTDANDITTYSYYTNTDADLGKRGNVATITNALGHVTSITAYNGHGRPLTIVDPNGLTTNLGYDPRQRLTSRNVGGELTSYLYDFAGQLTKVTLPDGGFLSYSYDAAHRLTGISDSLGNRIAYTLDATGNRTQEQVFDPVNALAQARSRVFNNLNRLSQEIGAAGQTTQYTYDNQGNLTSVDGPLTGTVDMTANAYDALNRLRQVTDPNNGVTRYAYNGVDQLISVTDPRSLATTYNYDGLANLNLQVSPDTGTTTNTYDAAGNLLTQTDAKGQVTASAYDPLNRVVVIGFADGSVQAYGYDAGANGIGRLSTITELSSIQQIVSAITYAYDQRGRTISEMRMVNGDTYTLTYAYDSFGRLTGITYPSGRTVAYSLDALGRISQVSTTPPASAEAQVVASDIVYQPFGAVRAFTFGNGQTYARGFDLDGRVSSYSLGARVFAIGYDAASRVSFITDSANPADTNTYSYDALDRLIGAMLPNTPFAYAYDAVGNRTSKTVGSSTDTYAYSATSNQLSSITAQSGAVRSFVFDANGSTTSDGANQYAYDARGRMVESTGALGITHYQVNALGQRVRKTNAADGRVFLYDTRGHLIAETDPGGGLVREYLYLDDIPLAVIQ